MEDLEILKKKTEECFECSLGAARTNLVFGQGNPDADIVFIGEAPGRNEDLQGVPFVGAAGKILTELLAGIGINRDDVYIANVLKCRPPENRDPTPEEAGACKPILFEQLKIINPRVIVPMGAHAARAVLAGDKTISQIHGKFFDYDGYTVFPIFHPAATIYDRSKREILEEDFRILKEFLWK